MKEQHIIFCKHYLNYKDEFKASELAGYSPSYGKRLLKNPDIIHFIQNHISKNCNIADSDEILAYLTSIMRGDEGTIQRYTPKSEIPDMESYKTIPKSSITVKDRIKAAELLAKHYKIFSDKQENDNVLPIIISGDSQLKDL